MLPRSTRNKINQANAEKQAQLFWTPERTSELRTRAAAGDSARVIAAALGTTRNAVIAKCHRKKIPLVWYARYLDRVRVNGLSRRRERDLRRAEKLRAKIKNLDDLRTTLETRLEKISQERPSRRVSRATSCETKTAGEAA